MRRTLIKCGVAGVMVLTLVSGYIFGCTESPAAAPIKPIELKLATHMPSMHFYVKTILVPFTKEVEKRTNGKVKITIYDSGTLGKVSELYDVITNRTVDIAVVQPGQAARPFKMQEVFYVPYLIPAGMADPVGSEIRDKLFEKYLSPIEFKDVRVLWTARWEPLDLMTTKKPVRTVADAQGLTVGITGGKASSEFLKVMGASPEQVRMTEMYTALERGMVDGVLMAGEPLLSFKFTEVVKYVTHLGLPSSVFFGGMNHQSFNNLPADVQKVIVDLVPWMENLQNQQFTAREQMILKTSKAKGVEFIELSQKDHDNLFKNSKHIEDMWLAEMEKLRLPGKEMLADVYKIRGPK